uniref:C2 domain-containing protein n=2 Tax=Panagrellus redivivus TaxID=6233 RepID=A0A7E4VS45_PANRE
MSNISIPQPNRPPHRLKPLKLPKQAWVDPPNPISEEPTTSQVILDPERLLSPPAAVGVRVAQPGESVSNNQTPETSNMDSYREILDAPLSPSVSSTTSKRTSLSAEISAQIRQRIRQQAKTMVKKKRGSVQLAKRLLRSQTLTTTSEIEEGALDNAAIDDKITTAIEAGKRFTTVDPSVAPETVQKSFFESLGFKSDKPEEPKKPTPVFFNRSVPRSAKNEDKFRSMLTTYGRIRLANANDEVEDPMARMNANMWTVTPERDYNVFMQREGRDRAFAKAGIQRTTEILTDQPLRLERDPDASFGLLDYTKAVNWHEWDVHARHGTEYFQLDLDLNRIEFDHHWLFSKEDVLVRKIKTLHHAITQTGTKAVEFGKKYLMDKVSANLRIMTDQQRAHSDSDLASAESTFGELLKEYQSLADAIEATWGQLLEERSHHKVPSTTLTVTKVDLPRFPDFEMLPEGFMEVPVYLLERVEPDEEEKKLAKSPKAMQKVRLQVLIFFNDILVCRTASVKLLPDFSVEFRKVYQLRIYEPPENIMLVIRENHPGKGWMELARVYVPFPEDLKVAELEELDFGSDVVVEGTSKYLGCGHPTKKSPCIAGRLFCRLQWSHTGPRIHRMLTPKSAQTMASEDDAKFELIPKALRLVSDEEHASDIRLEALSKRWAGGGVFQDNNHWIGLTSAEVDSSWISEGFKDETLTGLDFSMDAMRRIGNRYASLIRTHLVEQFSKDKRHKTHADVIKEVSLPTSFGGFGDLFGPADLSRKLKPMRTPASRVNTAVGKLRLVVNIQSAANLPERIDKTASTVFVECKFQNSTGLTLAVAGKSPNWQETLTLDVVAGADLRTIIDSLEVNVYDQKVNKLPSDDREPNSIHEQMEKTWLASLSVPFSTIYSLGKIDGILIAKRPLFLTGYKFPHQSSYIKMMITLDPPLTPPAGNLYANFLPGEPESIMLDAKRFESRVRAQFPERRIIGLVNDANGKRILPCRYLRPIKPPYVVQEVFTNVGSNQKAIELAAHMVSCIPFVTDPIMFPGVSDLWTTTEQLLTIGCGDEEEHAILLACWLMSLQLPTVLILGHSLPEGAKGAFVLVQINSHLHLLANASDGNVYAIDDPLCPLMTVGTVVTAENVFANIQKTAHPCLMDFDLKNKSNWDPLFQANRFDLATIQPSELTYTAVNEDILVELRTNLEREIKLRFDEARQYAIPQWNLMASRALREILVDMDNTTDIATATSPENIEYRLGQVLGAYKIKAVAFRCPFVSREKLVADVLRTNLHINSNRQTQFALCVHVQPFVNSIISCCVGVATLLPKHV